MKDPVIHLEKYFLEKVLIQRRDEDNEEEYVSISFDFDYEIKRNQEKPNLFMLTFIVRDDPHESTTVPQAYDLDLRIVGLFRFHEDVEEKDMQYLIRYNGCTILYGILRGMLTTISGSFPEGPINLPTVMIESVIQNVEARRQTNRAKKKTTKKRTTKKVTKKAAKKAKKK